MQGTKNKGEKYYESGMKLTDATGYVEFTDVPEGEWDNYNLSHPSGESYYGNMDVTKDVTIDITLNGAKKEE
jgi:hypothetical protein